MVSPSPNGSGTLKPRGFLALKEAGKMHGAIIKATILALPFLVSLTSHAATASSPERVPVPFPRLAIDHHPSRDDHGFQQPAPDRGAPVFRVGSDAETCDFNSLSAALAAAPSGSAILLESTESLYLGGTYGIFNRSLVIRGGFASCTDDTPSGRTVLDAQGNDRVFDIWLPASSNTPMSVALENLVIRGGQPAFDNLGGGGILVEGRGNLLQVSLRNVEVADNTVNDIINGGGIHVLANGPSPGTQSMLTIDNNSRIIGNMTEGNGGGLACSYSGASSFDTPRIRIGAIDISGNSAVNGGGLAIENCYLFVFGGGPIVDSIPTGAIFANQAIESGGGLYATGVYSFVSVRGLRFNSNYGNNDHAAQIVQNQAATGGGVFASHGANVLLLDTVISNNSATGGGGGIFVAGGQVTQGRQGSGACPPETTTNGVTTVPLCSRAKDNSAGGAGGAYMVTNGAALNVDRTIITGNSSIFPGSVARFDNGSGPTFPSRANFRNLLVYGNVGSSLFSGEGNSRLLLSWSTITGNNVSSSVIRSQAPGGTSAEVSVLSSIIWESVGDVFTSSGNVNGVADCVIGHQEVNATAFNTPSFYSNQDPLLALVDDKPYFPQASSPAIDYCDGISAEPDEVDLPGSERGSPRQGPPLPPFGGVPGGTYDIGAYETNWPGPDTLFNDRFEARFW
ncbi:MAG: hypothetical protein ACXIUL_13490 [Wenzhouxiangella sp.]